MHITGEIPHEASWDDLRHFAAFAHAKSLSAAAARLRVDHATVGRRIASLERTLGVKLVDRRARVPALTAEGERIAALVLRMEDAALGVTRAARGLAPAIGGEVSVSAPPTLANALIAPRLGTLHARHPAIRIRLLGEKRIASLARREADVSLRLVRPTEAGAVGRKLGSFVFALYGERGYVAGPRGGRGVIAFDEDGARLPQQRALLAYAGKRGRSIVLRTNDLESQIAAARAGVGVAALPDFVAARHPELVRVRGGRAVARDVWLVVHEDLRAAPSVRAVIDFLVEACRALR